MQTTLQTRIQGHDDVLDALSDLMNRVERALHREFCAGRKWTGDLAVSFYKSFGISAKLMESCYAARQAKVASATELAKLHVGELRDKLDAKRRQVDRKTKSLKTTRKKIDAAAAVVAKAEAKLVKLRAALDAASPARRPQALQQYKTLTGIVHHERDELAALMSTAKRLQSSLHQHQRKIQVLGHKLERALERTENPSICFGAKKLFKAQHHLQENGFASHAEWLEAWRRVRSATFMIEGAASAPSGNQFARLAAREDGLFNLELRLPEALSDLAAEKLMAGSTWHHVVRIQGLCFPHRADELREALSRQVPIAIRFHRADHGWRIMPSFKSVVCETAADYCCGAVGVDLNAGHVSVTRCDRFGNMVETFDVPLVTYGKSGGQAKDACRQVAARIATYAAEHDLPLVAEQLDFSDKKKRLSQAAADPRRARQLSSFAYSAFAAALDSACARKGVHLRRVNPAYTSIIGRTKFASRYGLSVHAAAALAIARRAMRLSEKLPPSFKDKRQVRLSLDDARHVTLELPARKDAGAQDAGTGHVWSDWRRVGEALRGVHAARRPSGRKRPSRSILGRGDIRSMVGRSGRTVSGSSPQPRNRRVGSGAAPA